MEGKTTREIEEKKTEENTTQELYLKRGAHIGTKNKSFYMKKFIFKKRQDKLKVMNVTTIDKRISYAANLISSFDLEKIIVVGKRAYAKKPIKEFCKLIGCKAFTERFVPGTLTNAQSKEFSEANLIIITETKIDFQAVKEAKKMNLPVIALSSTNNEVKDVDFVIPINNKGRKSLALAYWLLAKRILEKKGLLSKEKEQEFQKKLKNFEYVLSKKGYE